MRGDGGGGGGGGGVIVFGLYSTVSVVSMSSAFNISSDISESCSAMYREHAVYVRLEKNLYCSFVFKKIERSGDGSSSFLARLILHYK